MNRPLLLSPLVSRYEVVSAGPPVVIVAEAITDPVPPFHHWSLQRAQFVAGGDATSMDVELLRWGTLEVVASVLGMDHVTIRTGSAEPAAPVTLWTGEQLLVRWTGTATKLDQLAATLQLYQHEDR